MTSLIPLENYQQIFSELTETLKYYSNNLRNEIFEQNEEESNSQSYQRGESLFDQSEENLKNINEILEKEKEINQFFILCKENKQKLLNITMN